MKNNVTTCIVNYGLIPTVSMGRLLTDIPSALRWIQYNASKYNGNPNQLIISGHSAGGHLALITYILNEDLRPSILGICSLSGIFDLNGIKIPVATLRPETLFGVTNIWINPQVMYQKIKVNDEIWITSPECARKLGFLEKKIEVIEDVSGSDFVGQSAKAPHSSCLLYTSPSPRD